MRGWDRFYRFFYQPRSFGRVGRQGRGFTLLELLAVVATIVIFSSILMTSNQNAINQANVNLQLQQETQLKEALHMWVLNQGLTKAKKEWQDNIQNDPEKILEAAKTMLAPSTRGVYRLSKDNKIVSDASINTGSFFDVAWDVNGSDDVIFDGPVVNPTAVPAPSAVNPSPAPSPSPGTSPLPSPAVSPTASPSPTSSPTASPVASPPPTASPTPELLTVSPYLQESSLSLLLYPRAVAPNTVADLKVIAENPADVPLTFTLSNLLGFPSGLRIQSWDSTVKAQATLNAGVFSWKGEIPANGSVEVNFKLISSVIADYPITFRLVANVTDNPILAGDGFQNEDTTLLKVMTNPPPPGSIWDFAPVPTPSPVVKGQPITLAIEPIYFYDPAVRDVYMSVAVPSSLCYLGFADASGARYLGQEIAGTTRTVRFFLGRGDRDLSGVKPKLIFSSNDVGVAQTNGGLGRTIAASDYSEALNSLTWIAAPTPSPTPVQSKFELREFAKGPRPAPTPVIIRPGENGSLLLVFRNNNTVPVGYRAEITAASAIMLDGTAVNTPTSSKLILTGTAPARDIVDLSSKLNFFSLTDNPSFTVKIFRGVETIPDLQPPELPVLNWKD